MRRLGREIELEAGGGEITARVSLARRKKRTGHEVTLNALPEAHEKQHPFQV